MLLKRVVAGISSNAIFQGVSSLIHLFGVPLCLIYWGQQYYGEWILLFTIPGYLSVSDFGLGTAATSEMSMMAEGDRKDDIQPLLRSVFWAIVIWGLIPFGGLLASNYFLPWYSWLKLQEISFYEFKCTFPILVLYIYLSLFLTIPLNFYRVIKRYNIERYISLGHKILEFTLLLILVLYGFGIFQVALAYLILRVFLLLYVVFDLRQRSFYFRLLPIRIHWVHLRKVLKPGASVLMFYLGSNLLMQGTSTIVGLNLGAKSLVVFNTVRTLVNMVKQIIGVINLSLFSEFSYSYGAKNLDLFIRLLRSSILINFLLSTVACVILFFLGEYILYWWTVGVVSAEVSFFRVFLVYTLLGSLSSVALTVLLATNIFKRTGYIYLGMAVLLIIVNVFWIKTSGLEFMAYTLVIFELIFILISYKVLFSVLETNWWQLVRNLSFREFWIR